MHALKKTILVKAVINYPIFINQEIEVDNDITPDALKERVLEYADLYLSQGSSTPVIESSETHPHLVNIDPYCYSDGGGRV